MSSTPECQCPCTEPIAPSLWSLVSIPYADISTCRALYAYEPQQEDELQLEPDDVVYVTEKMTDDWWKGELNGQLGIFPATYVQENGSSPDNGEGGDYAFGLS